MSRTERDSAGSGSDPPESWSESGPGTVIESDAEPAPGTGAPGDGDDGAFVQWYLTLFTGIVATLCLLVLAFAGLSPIVVGEGFIGGNLLLMAGLGFIGSILIVVSTLPAPGGESGTGVGA